MNAFPRCLNVERFDRRPNRLSSGLWAASHFCSSERDYEKLKLWFQALHFVRILKLEWIGACCRMTGSCSVALPVLIG